MNIMEREPISDIVEEYKLKIKEKFRLPKFSNSRNYMGGEGEVTAAFLHYLCIDKDLMFEFLTRCKLLRPHVRCKCTEEMVLVNEPASVDGKVWVCMNHQKMLWKDQVVLLKCTGVQPIRQGSWFSLSTLSIPEILWISYAVVNKTPIPVIGKEYGVNVDVLTEWAAVCRTVYIYYVEANSKRIGGEGKTVEVDESNFGGKRVKDDDEDEERWVLGGIERGSGECFLIPIKDRTSDTLVRIIKDWVLPGTTIVSDSWEAYKNLQDAGFDHQPANYKKKGANCNTIEGTWRHIKAMIPDCSKDEMDFVGYLATFVFHRHCQAIKVDVFVKFLEMIRLMHRM